jgi:hypothetical protein
MIYIIFNNLIKWKCQIIDYKIINNFTKDVLKHFQNMAIKIGLQQMLIIVMIKGVT